MANAFDSMFTPAYTNSISDTGDGAGSSPGSPQSHTYEEQDGKHTGLAGAGRDILGFLGDFLLKKIGMPAMYAPAQQQRQLDAAGQGFDQDPSAAIDRIKSVDFNRGVQMQQNQQSADSLNNYREGGEERRQAAITAANDKRLKDVRSYSAAMLNSNHETDPAKRAEIYQQQRQQIAQMAGNVPGFNIDTELPTDMDDSGMASYVGSNIPVSMQINQTLKTAAQAALNRHRLETEATGNRNADTNSSKADTYATSVANTGVHQGNQDTEAHTRTGIQGANAVTGAANAVSKAAGVQVQAAKLALPKKGQRLPDLRLGREGQFITIK